MASIYILLTLGFAFLQTNPVTSFCLPGCTCTDDSFGRSLLCMATALRRIPDNIPHDVKKIRIENSHLTELPQRSFSAVSALEFLWLNFNNITVMHLKSLEGLKTLTELRLQGNKLRSVPWTAFQDTPILKILDLKHNRLDVLPEYALRYLPGLTYLDLSFNQLTVISKDVFLNWPLYHAGEQPTKKEDSSSNVVLALHDNPWLCDCRLKGFVQFVKSVRPPIILMNSYLTCSGPQFKMGKYFHEVELKNCMKPEATSPVHNISLPFGLNVTLTCLAKARPSPAVWWTYGLKLVKSFNVSQMYIDDDTVKSELVVPSLHLRDSGTYTCTASNFIGNSSVNILLRVTSPESFSPYSSMFPISSSEENVYIEIRIAKQTVYGITIEWYATTDNPAETWYTLHFGRYEDTKKELIYIGPGINTYSVDDLLPATKYEVCVTLKNLSPRRGQCIVFVTGSDISELEQREKLIHIIVIVCAMVLAVPAGMYACTTETRFSCFEKCSDRFKRSKRSEKSLKHAGRQGTFDSLQAGSDEGLCNRDSSEDKQRRRRSDDRALKARTEQINSAELY
ncbi:leucine-rich repeat, immunoglobulin-like domain and transmembrane domain-containing protein 2 [Erpetoichthys calabaricus]|uniref:leucine-rich repeat, immunoglobulin-like domain and transmembrane domain-containing protein 2 n=1 Tax=Erpetoichthys calabaricus TaxID=27687 RepID=UPI002234B1C7|nr:leucine-rich repeat, immunoglobulin-like domain and transmembrane domain-containing protein 2 [Erpetoichthys calabaricus]